MTFDKALTLGLQLSKWLSGIFCILAGLLALRFRNWDVVPFFLLLGLGLMPYTHHKIKRWVPKLTYAGVMLIFFVYMMALLAMHGPEKAEDSVAQESTTPSASQGMQEQPVVDEDSRSKLKAMVLVETHLKDPTSARFGNEFTISRPWVCGYVSAKNAFGGYTGMMPFIVQTDSGWTQVAGADTAYLFKDYYLPYCQGRKPKSLAH